MVFPNAFPVPVESADLSSKKIINVGGLKKNKNIFPLLEAFSDVVKVYPDWSLDVYSAVGSGAAAKEYFNLVSGKIESLRLGNNVFIKEQVDDIYKEFFKSSIHVITSLSEGLSNSVCEAMCCGVPTIGIRRVPGVDGLVLNDLNGILLEGDSVVEGLKTAICELIEDKNYRERLGRQARIDAACFEPDEIFKKWDEVIDFALNNKNKFLFDEVQAHYQRCELI
jgi:glycosyltransferase involved in cell wall biosynthesis